MEPAITGHTALRLAHFFGTSAEFWLNLQSLYELRLAKKKAGKSIRALPGSNGTIQYTREKDVARVARSESPQVT